MKILKIYDSVLTEFNEFIKDHKEFKQQDIASLALKEFLESIDLRKSMLFIDIFNVFKLI